MSATLAGIESVPGTGFDLSGPAGAPVVIVLGGISADARVTAWWSAIVGADCAIDTSRVQVLGVSHADDDGITTHGQAERIAQVLDSLGIERVDAIVGASYGGMVALAFAERFPARVGRIVAISAAHESHPMARAQRSIQRRIVELGLHTGRGEDALAIARGLAVTTYRTTHEFGHRFRAPGSVESYLAAHGERFVRNCSPRRFLALSRALDAHRVTPEAITVPTTLVGVAEDALVPFTDIKRLARRIAAPVHLERIHSIRGHDAFLTEPAQIAPILSTALADLRS